MVGPRGWMSGRADARYNMSYCRLVGSGGGGGVGTRPRLIDLIRFLFFFLRLLGGDVRKNLAWRGWLVGRVGQNLNRLVLAGLMEGSLHVRWFRTKKKEKAV